MRRWRGFRRSSPDLAIDLGTANTLVYVAERGVVVREPSVVAIDERTGEVLAVGLEAKQMIGRTPASIHAIRPLRHGVIADFEVTEQMLRQFMGRVRRGRLSAPRMVLCAPWGITEVERRALVDASRAAGASDVALIEEPMAAAIGSGLTVAEPQARMIVDIGGATTEAAVISMGGFVTCRSVRTGGHDFDELIAAHLRSRHRLAIGIERAEQVKFEVGSAWPAADRGTTEVRGRDLSRGTPSTMALSSAEVRELFAARLSMIVAAVREALEVTPPELAGDVTNDGIHLAGGGALLAGIAQLIAHETGLRVTIVDDPLTCVAEGAGRCLQDFDTVLHASRAWSSRDLASAAGGVTR